MTMILVVVGLVVELLVMAYAVVASMSERRRLDALVAAAGDPEALKSAIESASEAEQQIASALVEVGPGKGALDEVLVQGMVVASGERFGPRFGAKILGVAALFLLAFAPMIQSAITTAQLIAQTVESTQRAHRASAYLEWQTRLEGPFAGLRDASRGTGLLLVGLAFVAAVLWWLRRAEVREARLVRAMLELAIRLRPQANIPIGARMAELLAPDRGLSRPIAASVIWVVAVTFGFFFLHRTAEVRAGNGHQTTFNVWPEAAKSPITTRPDITLPREPAGSPIDQRPRPTLELGRETLQFQQSPIGELTDGLLPDPWTPNLASQAGLLSQYPKPLEANLLADENTSWVTAKTVMARLTAELAVARYHLVVVREVRHGSRVESLQAVLPIELGIPQMTPALTLKISGKSIKVGPELTIPLTHGWQSVLRARVRKDPTLLADRRGPIEVELDPGVELRLLTSVMAAADSACLTDADCGLPGLGLRFVIRN